jgi:LPXTG-motif cell wall-anchored protein
LEQSATSDASTNPYPDNIVAIAAVLGGLSFVLSIIALFVLYRRRKKEDRLESALESEPLSFMWMPGFDRDFLPTKRVGNYKY